MMRALSIKPRRCCVQSRKLELGCLLESRPFKSTGTSIVTCLQFDPSDQKNFGIFEITCLIERSYALSYQAARYFQRSRYLIVHASNKRNIILVANTTFAVSFFIACVSVWMRLSHSLSFIVGAPVLIEQIVHLTNRIVKKSEVGFIEHLP